MKQTEIDSVADTLITDDWEVKSLGEVATIVGGGTPSTLNSAYWNGDIQWFTPAELSDSKKYVSKSERTITERGLKESSAKLLPKGTVLLTTRASIGITAILENPASTNQGFQSLIAKNNCCSEFLYYVIPLIKDEMLSRASGSTFAEISAKKLSTITFQLPPLPEQQRIAKALSDVDALISTTEKLIQKKKNIKQGTMQNLLTGKKRLPGFGPQTKSPTYKQTELGLIPEDWEVMSLGEFCQIKDGTHGTYARVENGYLLLSAKNILNGKLDIQESESLISENAYKEIVKNGFPKKKDLLISCVGTIGRCCIFDTDEEIAFQRSVAFIRQNQIDNLFLMYFIQSDLFQKQLREAVNASTLGGVYLGAFNPLQISFSSDKKEQTAIASVLSSMDKEIETLNTKLEKYRNLKTAMMQQLLTGKIRLVK